jgi:cell division protein FtsI (penicillin-binding protein 3)
MTNNKSDILWRIYLVYFLTVAFGVLILVKVAYIQFVDGERWRELARNATMRYVSIDAIRGDILADDGRLLATSVPVYEIRMDLHKNVISDELFSRGIDSLSLNLSRLFRDRSHAEYKRLIVQARRDQERYFLVKRGVSYNQLVELRQFPIFRHGRFKGGLVLVERNRREVPFKSLAARTIGYEREGVYVGLEGAYREYLEGVQGKRLMQRISGGNWMPVNDENEIRSQNGKDIITTINVNMQDVVESALQKQLQHYNARHGTAVVMEVATGKIKAISNLTRTEAGGYEESFNYAIGESAEPGSTFKLASMMALLEDGLVKPDEFINTGDGTVVFADRVMRDSREGGFGTITIKQAFALSSNVAMSILVDEAYRRTPSRFINHLSNFGLDTPLEIEIKGEGKPYIPKPDQSNWSGVSLPWMSIGYGLSVTPLQILTLFNAIANDGRMMKPMFVEEVRQTGRTIKRFEPQVIKRSVCSRSTLETIKEMLEEVVESGTASAIKTPVYRIAGKTGTAQVASGGGVGYRSGDRRVYRASFAGYFPADNPVYSMIVVLHDPRGWVFTGSQVAAPVFREIADKIYATQLKLNDNYLNTPAMASLPDIMSGPIKDIKAIYSIFNCKLMFEDKDLQWANAKILSSDTVIVSEREFIGNLVPNVVGMGLRDALYVLENAGMRVRFSGRGMVRSQSLRPGTRIVQGSEITIQLS